MTQGTTGPGKARAQHEHTPDASPDTELPREQQPFAASGETGHAFQSSEQ